MEALVIFGLGVFVGSLAAHFMWEFRTFGTLQIDHSNPKKDIYRIVFNKFVDLSKKKKVVLRVDNDADLSQQ